MLLLLVGIWPLELTCDVEYTAALELYAGGSSAMRLAPGFQAAQNQNCVPGSDQEPGLNT